MKKVYADKSVIVVTETLIPNASPRLRGYIAEAIPSDEAFPIAPLYEGQTTKYLIPLGGFDSFGRFQIGYSRLEAKARSSKDNENPCVTAHKLRYESAQSTPVVLVLASDEGYSVAFSRSSAEHWGMHDLDGVIRLGSLGVESVYPVFETGAFGALDLALIDLATAGTIRSTLLNIIPLGEDDTPHKVLASDLWTEQLTARLGRAYARMAMGE